MPEFYQFRDKKQAPWTYPLLDQFQKNRVKDIAAGKPGALILSELAPVVTLGKRVDINQFSEINKKIKLYQADRGGFETYHGPGQWVLFVVDSVEKITGDTKGVKKAVDMLLGLAQDVTSEFGVSTSLGQGDRLGVWTSKGKIASVGVSVKHGVLLHGLSINVFQTQESFYGIQPCGLDAQPDYLIKSQCDREFTQVGEMLKKKALEKFFDL